MKHRLMQFGYLVLAAVASTMVAKADPTEFTPDELVTFGKLGVEASVQAHPDLTTKGFLITGTQVGRITREGQTFDGIVVFYNYNNADGIPIKAEDVTHGLDRTRLPKPLTFDWVVKVPTPGDFNLMELLTVGKLSVDQSKIDAGGDQGHKVVTYKIFRSEADFPVVSRIAWRHTEPSGEVKKGEFKYGCHKHDNIIECHKEG